MIGYYTDNGDGTGTYELIVNGKPYYYKLSGRDISSKMTLMRGAAKTIIAALKDQGKKQVTS